VTLPKRQPAPALVLVLAMAVCIYTLQIENGGRLGAVLLPLVLLGQRRRFPAYSSPLMVLLPAWCLLSLAWNIAPAGSITTVVKVLSMLGCGWLMVRTQPWRRIGDVVSLGCTLFGLASLLAWVVSPATAWTPAGLNGVVTQNNSLGYGVALGLTSVVLNALVHGWRRVDLAMGAICLGTLVAANSMTSNIATLVALATVGAGMAMRRVTARTRALVLSVLVCTIGAAAFGLGQVSTTQLIGRDATLTGRTAFWPVLWELVTEHPLTGYGLGGPWAVGAWIRELMYQRFEFPLASAHNAILETLLQLGLIGLVIVVLLWLRAGLALVRSMLRDDAGWWPAGIAIFSFVHGLAESAPEKTVAWLLFGLVCSFQGRRVLTTASHAGR